MRSSFLKVTVGGSIPSISFFWPHAGAHAPGTSAGDGQCVCVGREAKTGGRAEAPGQSRHGRSRARPGSNPGSDPPMDPRARIQLRIRSAADPRIRIQPRIRPARGPTGPDPTKDPAKKNPDPTHGSGSKPVDPRVRIHRRLDLVGFLVSFSRWGKHDRSAPSKTAR